jgi:hypothetical protein
MGVFTIVDSTTHLSTSGSTNPSSNGISITNGFTSSLDFYVCTFFPLAKASSLNGFDFSL